jgi:fatty acid-binding protein DegV
MNMILSHQGKGSKALIIPGSLERLKLSGRISNGQYLLGKLLKICPIFYLENGQLTVLDKKRTFKKALNHMIETFSNVYPHCQSSSIVHFDFDQINEIKEQFPNSNLFSLHASLSIHFGRGTIGFLWNS